MKQYDFIQVLWVEDDPIVTETYPIEAEANGLELVPYPCWDDARIALENEYDRWSSIILDAKCKFHKDSADNAVVFLSRVLNEISTIAERNKRTIPWYILSGGDEGEFSELINEDRLKWDYDWTISKNKSYYSKNTDRDDLFHRIQIHANKSSRLLIHEMYREVFDAIEECGIDDEAYNLLEDLLILIHFPNETPDVGFLNVRKIMEYIYKSMGIWGILPKNKKVNLRWSSILLSGNNDATKSNGQIAYKSKKPIVPKIISDFMKVIIDTVSTEMHANSEDSIYEKADIPSYLPLVDNSTYLLKSYTFQLCDIILWYRNYLKNHQDIEQNKKNWEFVSK